MGTPSYMAPEQCDPAGTVSPAADVYALGAILYEALSGRTSVPRPDCASTSLELVRSHEPVPPRQLTPKIPATWKRFASSASLSSRRTLCQRYGFG